MRKEFRHRRFAIRPPLEHFAATSSSPPASAASPLLPQATIRLFAGLFEDRVAEQAACMQGLFGLQGVVVDVEVNGKRAGLAFGT